MSVAQFVDPAVSQEKFDREVAQFRELADEYRQRGWILLQAEFPDVYVMLVATQLKPPAVILGAHFNYANYDSQPPSVQLVNPFSFEPYKMKELPVTLNRRLPPVPIAANAPAGMEFVNVQPLMQGYGPESIPFLCIAGVLEYHEHPAHTGDAWELHRPAGAGKLARLLDVIYRYGVESISQYNIGLVAQINGFGFSQVPE